MPPASDAEETDEPLPCPCCGEPASGSPGDYSICPVCHWEDDPVQAEDPDYPGGANVPSLNQARQQWRESPQPPPKRRLP